MSFRRFGFVTLSAAVLALGAASACSSDDSPTTTDGPTGGASGSTGGSTGEAGAAGSGAGNGTGGSTWDPNGPPQFLSETGLFEGDMVTLAPGVEEFEPQFVLWSDGATKRRWISLPPDSQIDTTDMDFWKYPPGTRLWKEFTRDGVRVETRLLAKRPDGSWWTMAYQWNDDQTDAEARPAGVKDASNTPHDIPSQDDCAACHGKMADTVLGFSAIQLSHDGAGVTLADLIDRDALSAPPAGPFTVPGTAEDQAMLGYLHANCGTCHNHQSPLIVARTDLELWLLTGQLDSLANTPTFTTAVDHDINVADGPAGADKRIAIGSADTSAAYLRMGTRTESYKMPPLGTEEVDETTKALFKAWIDGL